MANKQISDLTAAGTLDGTEQVHVKQGANSRRTTTQAIANLAALAGGGWAPVDSEVAAVSGTIELLVDSAAYDEWWLVGRNVVLNGANELMLQVGTGGTPTYDTGNNYDFGIDWMYGTAGTGTASRAFVSATSGIRIATVSSASSPSGVNMDFDCIIKNLASGANMRLVRGEGDYDGSGGLTVTRYSGVHLNSAYDVSAFKFAAAPGTITSGLFALYGRNRP